MVGKGVLYECLKSPAVEEVLVVNRESVGFEDPKLKEIIHQDFYDISAIKDHLKGFNACFFCLGVSSFRMTEEEYNKITYGLTLHWAEILVELNPDMTFCYVSGTGTDSSEKGKIMWARVKGKTENAILSLPFKKSYMFRPGYIQPMEGIKSKTKLYNALYIVAKPLYPILKKIFPNQVTSTKQVGKAMIHTLTKGYEKTYLENRDINSLAAG